MKKSSPLKRKSIMTVSEFRSRFGDEVLCGEHLTAQRWPNGFVCPRCGGRSRGYMASRRVHECVECGYQSSVTAGTIFHKTRTPLTSWFWAIYRMSQDKKGISALQLSKEIGVSYPTAWLMQHKIRKAMADRDQGYQLKGLIEVDEGYVGGAEQGTRRSEAWILAGSQVMVCGVVSVVLTAFLPSPYGFQTAFGALSHWPVAGAALYLALGSTVFAFWGQATAQTRLGPTEAAVLFSLEPVVAAILSVVWLKEPMTARQAVGGALIVVAMIVADALPRMFRAITVPDTRP